MQFELALVLRNFYLSYPFVNQFPFAIRNPFYPKV